MQSLCLSRCHPFPFYCCALCKPLSRTLTGEHFCKQQSVCRDALFLHPNTYCSRLNKFSQLPWHWVFDTVFYVVRSSRLAIFCIGVGALSHGRDFYCFGILHKGFFLKNNHQFKIVVVCNGFCWVTVSNYLWCAQGEGDSYSQESKIEFIMFIYTRLNLKRTQMPAYHLMFWTIRQKVRVIIWSNIKSQYSQKWRYRNLFIFMGTTHWTFVQLSSTTVPYTMIVKFIDTMSMLLVTLVLLYFTRDYWNLHQVSQ